MHVVHLPISNSTGMCRAPHEQQAWLTTLAPLHWQARNIREESAPTHTHTHAHADTECEQRGWRRKEKRTVAAKYKKKQRTSTKKTLYPSIHLYACRCVSLAVWLCVLYILFIKKGNGSFPRTQLWNNLWCDCKSGGESLQRQISLPSPLSFKRHERKQTNPHIRADFSSQTHTFTQQMKNKRCS